MSRGEEARAWRALSAAFAALGQRGCAVAAMLQAVRLADGELSQRALGNLLFDSGQCDLALRCFERVSGR